ncbi:MAG TPA: glycoside hydrolase family 43 protein [Nocardioides sp.]|nr:glycoside hydrolase family 43 protein [Nocardioides sp.]
MRSRTGRLLRRTGLLYDPANEVPQVAVRLDEDRETPLANGLFVNPVAEGADPFVVRDGDGYLWCQTDADAGVTVRRSDRLTSLGEKHVVWRAPDTGPFSAQVWAPELVKLDGRWHIYFAASDGRNENHLAYVLVADSDDPLGSYSLHGPFNTGDGAGGTADNAWAIDMTVLEHGGRRYAVWSGWPDAATKVQTLYIAEMESPTSLAGRRVQLGSPYDHEWERIREDRPDAINEAPQPLVHGGRTFLVYSCGSALLPSYKLGLLELVGTDPLDPAAWRKKPEPVFTSTEATFGVGHSTFVQSPDESEWWHVYHAKIVRQRNFKRVIQVQPMGWSADGEPVFGEPVPAGAPLREPSGTPHASRRDSRVWEFGAGTGSLAELDYYGHQQYLSLESDGLHLGRTPKQPVNAYRSGEKVVLRDGAYDDVRVTARFRVVEGARAIGVLVRVTAPAVGFDAQRGYFAGWVPKAGRLVLRRANGSSTEELGSLVVPGGPAPGDSLVVEAVGTRLRVHLQSQPESRLEVEDDHYSRGSVGLRVVATHGVFTRLAVEPLDGA